MPFFIARILASLKCGELASMLVTSGGAAGSGLMGMAATAGTVAAGGGSVGSGADLTTVTVVILSNLNEVLHVDDVCTNPYKPRLEGASRAKCATRNNQCGNYGARQDRGEKEKR